MNGKREFESFYAVAQSKSLLKSKSYEHISYTNHTNLSVERYSNKGGLTVINGQVQKVNLNKDYHGVWHDYELFENDY